MGMGYLSYKSNVANHGGTVGHEVAFAGVVSGRSCMLASGIVIIHSAVCNSGECGIHDEVIDAFVLAFSICCAWSVECGVTLLHYIYPNS